MKYFLVENKFQMILHSKYTGRWLFSDTTAIALAESCRNAVISVTQRVEIRISVCDFSNYLFSSLIIFQIEK